MSDRDLGAELDDAIGWNREEVGGITLFALSFCEAASDNPYDASNGGER
jgi:hypothetical protein